MAGMQDTLAALKEALKISPDNLPLRQHLAETLLALGHFAEAESEFATALAMDPASSKIKLGLASASYQQDKFMQALVIVEDLVRHSSAPAGAFVLYARLLLNDGKIVDARRQYSRALEIDSNSADESLSEQLGELEPPFQKEPSERGDSDRLAVRAGAMRDEDDSIDVDIERPAMTFAEVGGMEDVKEQIRMKIIYPLTKPELFKAYGKKLGGGILMYGPPGCGKTHLARATAGEMKARFIAVGIDQVLDMWQGNSERNLHTLFDSARTNKPCVLFFDEVDALAASRTDLLKSGLRQVINQFLMELDGIQSSNEGVLILAATNAPWHLDPAFKRPGRFDRIIFVPPPDAPARADILRLMLAGKPLESLDFGQISKKMEKFSGADIKALVDDAVEDKIAQAMKDGVTRPITGRDLEKALKNVRASTADWFATARNYALYANEGGIYDDIKKYLKL